MWEGTIWVNRTGQVTSTELGKSSSMTFYDSNSYPLSLFGPSSHHSRWRSWNCAVVFSHGKRRGTGCTHFQAPWRSLCLATWTWKSCEATVVCKGQCLQRDSHKLSSWKQSFSIYNKASFHFEMSIFNIFLSCSCHGPWVSSLHHPHWLCLQLACCHQYLYKRWKQTQQPIATGNVFRWKQETLPCKHQVVKANLIKGTTFKVNGTSFTSLKIGQSRGFFGWTKEPLYIYI